MLSDANQELDNPFYGRYSGGGVPGPTLRLVSWNIERGLRAREVADFLRHVNAHVCLLQEVDRDSRRTGRRFIAEDLARELGYNFVFGTEWRELAQGSNKQPAFQGQATLARANIKSAHVLRFKEQSQSWGPKWYLPNLALFQPRLGGRIALVAEIEWAGRTLLTYNVHLESRVDEEGRLRQLRETIGHAHAWPAETPVIIAGDYNTRLRPSPVIAELRHAGFSNAIGEDYQNTKRDRSGSQDWIFVRGPVTPAAGKVHTAIQTSDHFPLTVELTLSGRHTAPRDC